MAHPTTFRNLADFARLPWFTCAEDGRLKVSDKSIGPIVDVHTHLALAYLRPMSVDLYKLHPATEHYLPACCSVDLDPYINRNFTPKILSDLTRDLTLMSTGPRGMRATHTVANLIREMDELGIERSVLLPIDFPAPLSENWKTVIEASKREPRLISYGSVHPYSPAPGEKVDAQAHLGAVGFKMHPAVQMVRPDDSRAMTLYKHAAGANLPVLWHCGPVGIETTLARYLSQVRHYEKPIAENPKTTFVLGHAGGLQADLALALCNKYPNVYLETSSQGLPSIRNMVDHANPDRIMFGSDWPFYHQAVPLAKVLIATEGKPELRKKILYGNAHRMLGLQ